MKLATPPAAAAPDIGRRHLLARALTWRAVVPVLLATSRHAAAAPAQADEVKAAYLYRFIDYVEWPAGTLENGVCIGISGSDTVYTELQRLLAARPPAGREISVVKVPEGAAGSGLQMLFIAAAASPDKAWIERLRSLPVLVVTEGPQGLALGSAINFVSVGDRLRFEAAPQAAQSAGLKLSSRLLAVAERVWTP